MSDLLSYFQTNWTAMTTTDWVGTVLTVIIFFLMLGMYIWVLRPKNKNRLEEHRNMLLEDEEVKKTEREDGR